MGEGEVSGNQAGRRGVCPLEVAKIWRGERVEESKLTFFGRHAWMLTLPALLFAATGWALSGEIRLFAVYLMTELGLYAVPAVALAAVAAAYLGATRRFGASEVELDEEELRIGSARVPRRDLAMAWATSHEELEIITHSGDELRMRFAEPTEMAELGARLRAAADRGRSYALTSGGRAGRMMRKTLGAYLPLTLSGLLVGAVPEAFWILPFAAALSWVAARGTRRARFGADGVSIEGRFRTRHVPYRDIARVSVERRPLGNRVKLVLDDGSSVLELGGMDAVRARLVAALIEEGVAMVERGEDAGAVLSELAPGASEDELLARLLNVSKVARYRDAAMEPDRLGRLIRNPAAAPAQRIAAAIALREAPGGRAQIRVAADVTTDPALRDTLAELADEQLDERRSREILRRMAS